MVERARLTDALVAFAHTLTAGYELTDVLHDLTARITGVLGVTGAGVSLIDGSEIRFVTSDHETISALERVQEQFQQGPCTDSIASGEPVLIANLNIATASLRWPEYVMAATRAGIVAVAAIPMNYATPIGALDLYDDRVHEWTTEEISTARVFSDIATAYVLNASQLERERRTVEQLQRALDSRIIIEQAKGILANDNRISVDQAFAMLRRHANNHNVTLHAVADAVVNLGLRPTS